MNKVFKELEKFALERDIHKVEPDELNYATNVIEELLEHIGFDVSKENRKALKSEFKVFVNTLSRKEIAIGNKDYDAEYDPVDSISDIMVFSITELMKRGYDPEAVLMETSKEVSSRTGSIIDGKFEKDLSKSHLWYKADYSKCKKEYQNN